jgi:hypothetical protein
MRVLGLLISLALLSSCGGVRNPVAPLVNNNLSSAYNYPGASESSVRYVFHEDHFTKLSDFATARVTPHSCLGDAVHAFYVQGEDYSGAPTSFPAASTSDDFLPTTKPGFIKNVAVDMTQTYYRGTVANTIQSDVCSYRGIANSAEPSACADFDPKATTPTPTITPAPTVSPTPSVTPFPTSTPYYWGKGFYRVRDEWCTGQGPIISPNEDTTKTKIGGVNIDLDRSQLGNSEDLLMVMTYQALNENASWPSAQYAHDNSILEVNLIGTQLSLDLLIGAPQPRPWGDNSNAQMPIYMKTIAHLEDPFSSLRTEQLLIPLSQNPLIDRIRVERIRGSFHLYQIDLYRMGNRGD